jgi:hypothetical protein
MPPPAFYNDKILNPEIFTVKAILYLGFLRTRNFANEPILASNQFCLTLI